MFNGNVRESDCSGHPTQFDLLSAYLEKHSQSSNWYSTGILSKRKQRKKGKRNVVLKPFAKEALQL